LATPRHSLRKTTRPSVSGILPRERLFRLLDGARAGPAAWISGPPGSGKTSLVASYLEQARGPCLWYQLDEGDGDAATFFYYLGMEAGPSEGTEPLPLLTPEYQRALGVFTRRYFQQLYARLKAPFTLVFDNYQEISAYSPLHDVMRDAIAELPAGGFAICVSRGDPPATFARLRANRELKAIDWEDLRLTKPETAAIARRRDASLPDASVDALYASTQGWAAGLVLMLEQAKYGPIAASSLPDISRSQLIFDYLAGEIFQKLGERTQELLLATAYLSFVTPDVAVKLTGLEDAGALLEELDRSNDFVVHREVRTEPVYQYHPMLREFLRARADSTYPKERRRGLQKRSAALLEAAGEVDEALALFRDGQEWDEMARVIGAQAESMLAQGRGETVRHWVESLPPEVQTKHPWMLYWAAASQAPLAPREARLQYAKAFELFESQPTPDPTGRILSASGALDAILYEQDDLSLMDRWMGVLDEAVKGGAAFPSPAVEARVFCSMFTAATLREPHRRDTREWIERGLAAARETQDPNVRIWVGALATVSLLWTGLYAKSWALIESMRRTAQLPGVTPFSLTTLKHVELEYFMFVPDVTQCLKAMDEGIAITRATGAETWLFQMINLGYAAALGCGDLEKAAELARRFDAQGRSASRFDLVFYRHFRGWEAILRKDLMLALQEEKAALRMAIEVGCPYFEVLSRLALAEILAECGDARKSIAHLQQLRPIVEQIHNHHLEFTCLLGFARLAIEHGRYRAGMTALRRGLALGREYGYTHFLWWRPATMARLCAYALEEGIETEYVRDLIKRRNLTLEAAPVGAESWPWRFKVRAFGPFEITRQDEPIRMPGKAQKRPLELLKVVVAHGGERVSEAHVTEAMWPRIDGDSAHRSFTSTLHRLRKLLGDDKAIVLHEGRLTLDRRFFWVDAWAFDQLVDEIDTAFKRERAGLDSRRVERYAERLLQLYRGTLFANEPEEPWHIQARERKRNRFVRAMSEIGRYWEEGGQWNRVLECYEKCLDADPYAETFYRQLIACYRVLDRKAEAVEAYNRCRKALASLNVEPSPETLALYEKI
jgi:ATP/maltotriose-dependent transcriptional regulator MalT/two-component SAPR family response regulator